MSELLDNNVLKIKALKEWLYNNIILENKKDFLRGWTVNETDED